TEPTTGSIELQAAVHAELVKDLRLAWDPAWVNRGKKAADFGELRELSTIPGVLLEVAFHDTEDPGDADDLREPLFRQIAARAVYQGIVKYHAAREGSPVHLLPEPPERLMARNSGPGQVTISWQPPPCCDGVVGDAATAYKVYHSTNGRGFDDGLVTAGTSATISGLAAGSLHFFRVTALNEGGESFATPIVAVRTALTGSSVPFLIVDGFDRLDGAALIPVWESYFLGTVQRMFLERMNAYSYAVEHGWAISGCGLAFDGAANEAVEAGDLALDDYQAIDWFTGEDSLADASLSNTERALLRAYLDSGGRLLLSGAEIGYDLVERGRDPAFFGDYLRATYLGDNAGTHDFAGLVGGPFEGLAGSFDDGNGRSYAVGYPDRLGSANGSTPVLRYEGGTTDGAAVAYADGARVIYLGFPLEAIVDAGACQSLMCAAAGYLLDGPETLGAQRLINPGFEGGTAQSAWQIGAPAADPVLVQRDSLPPYIEPFDGNWLAWLGGYTPGSPTTVALTQTVALPSGEPEATLSLAWFVQPAQVPANPNDRLSLGVYDLAGTLQATLLEVTAKSLAGVWQTAQFDLGAFSGDTVQLAFQAASQDTGFFVDQVNLDTSGPRGRDEFRALWVDAYHDGIKNRRQIDELIETANAGSFNALVVQVRRRGDTYYPSAIDPWAPDANPNFDALAYLIDRAHAAGIEVHAWATTLAIWGSQTIFPADPNHTYYLHGPGTSGEDYWLMTRNDGEEFATDVYYLDPGHPDVVDYTVAVYAELAANYALDGVHLDRVRYPYNTWGYNPTALARFQAQTGREDVPEPADAQWAQWRRDQVTALVRKIYLTVTAINPRLRVSAATSAAGYAPTVLYPWETRTPYTHHFQDWRAWLEEGILDLALPMTYRREDDLAGDFDRWIAWEKDHQYGRGTVIGTGLYINSVADSMAQWLEVRQPSSLGNRALGMVGYSYATPSDEDESRRAFVNAAVSEVFTQSVRTQGLYWKDAPSLGHLAGTLTQHLPCSSLDAYPITLTGPQSRSLLTDGSGWFGSVDLPPGDYLLWVEPPAPERAISVPVTIVAGEV
ncbi:MAG: family 10 glycosylhydrolase, partial [Anaerolineae bacterium]